MALPEIPATWVAVIGTCFGGLGLKFADWLLNRSKNEEDAATSFRKELREEIATLRAELGRVSKEVDEWREKYYDVLEELIASKAKLIDNGHYEEVLQVSQGRRTTKKVTKND